MFRRYLWACLLAGFLPFMPCALRAQTIEYQEAQVAFSPKGDALGLILDALQRSRRQVDVAMAFLTHDDLINALCLVAQRPGITVRFITDDEMDKPAQRPILERMAVAGIETHVVTVPGGKMHLKMVVVDNDLVISGTANWTRQAFEANIEDTVLLRSASLAQKYREQMDRLIAEGTPIEAYSHEDPRKLARQYRSMRWPTAATPGGNRQGLAAPRHRTFRPSRMDQLSRSEAGKMEAWFTFEPGVVEALETAIRSATNRIDVGMYLLNQPELVQALVGQAQNKQVKVRTLFDVQMREGSFMGILHDLVQAGCEVQIYGGDRHSLHMKTLIVDDRQVWTGSANWTKGAMGANIEDLLCFHSSVMAAYYRAFLDQVAARSERFDPPIASTGDVTVAGCVFLPPAAPRTNYTDLVRTPFDAFEFEAKARYLPDDQYLPALVDVIRNADQNLLMLMYAFPAPETAGEFQTTLVRELTRAAGRGVYVYLGLYTPSGGKDRLGVMHSDWAERLRAAGIDVRLCVPSVAQHDKLVVADLQRVLIGSHNWSEGALSGKRVFESSVLLDLSQPDLRWADYVMGRQVVSDMRTRNQWEAEIDLLRRLHALPSRERRELTASLETTAAPMPTVAGWSQVREAFMSEKGDRIFLRDGRLMAGQWMGSQSSRCQWRFSDGQILWMEKPAIQLLWREPQSGSENGLPRVAEAIPAVKAVFLPQSTFGLDLLEGVKKARKSIYIATYNLSEGQYGPLEEFYDVLRQKGQAGVEVVLVTEFGPGTSAFLKRSVLNFASTLATGDIQVRFMQDYKVMHKKLVVVDGETVWLGSANLTTAGLSISSEANVRIQDPAIASQVETDFHRLVRLAKPISELKY